VFQSDSRKQIVRVFMKVIQLKVNQLKKHAATSLAAILVIVACTSLRSEASTLPPSTAVPVVFTTTIKAGSTKVNDPIWAKTMQVVLLPRGETIPKGSIVSGHVVASRPFVFNDTPYEKQTPSVLAIHFDKIEAKGTTYDVNFSVRALASASAASNARMPVGAFEGDPNVRMVQIGGDYYYPGPGSRVYSSDGTIVAYSRHEGVFARLIAGAGPSQGCDATTTEQSVGIFSADACGLFGFDAVSMTNNGQDGSGTFRLESVHYTVDVPADSAALLETPGTGRNESRVDQSNCGSTNAAYSGNCKSVAWHQRAVEQRNDADLQRDELIRQQDAEWLHNLRNLAN
jgi:hypothetical protein